MNEANMVPIVTKWGFPVRAAEAVRVRRGLSENCQDGILPSFGQVECKLPCPFSLSLLLMLNPMRGEGR